MWTHRLPLVLWLCAAAPALGKPDPKGRVQQYEAKELDAQQQEAARVKARYRMGVWREDPATLPTESELPWRAIALTIFTLGLAAPLGWRMYRSTVAEISGQTGDARVRRRRG